MKVNDAITGALLIVFALAVFFLSQGAPSIRGSIYSASLFPRMVAGLMGVCGAYLIAKEVHLHLRGHGTPLFATPEWVKSRWLLSNFLLIIAALVIYILFSEMVGFDIIGTAILFVLFTSLRRGHVVSSFFIAMVATFAIHYVFGHFLRVPLPWGIFENYAFF